MNPWMCGRVTGWPAPGNPGQGLFATVAVNADAANGLFFGNLRFAVQLIAVIVTIVFAFGMTYVLAKGASCEHWAAREPDRRRGGAGPQLARRTILLISRSFKTNVKSIHQDQRSERLRC